MKFTVRFQLMLTLGMVLVLLLALLGISLKMAEEAADQSHLLSRNAQTADTAHAFRFHVAEVQQFLTDVSATGDEGGYEEARSHYQAGLRNLQEIVDARPDLRDRIEDVKRHFERFNAVGMEMAAAYVRDGREAGNQIMKMPETGFDARAESLVETMEPLLVQIDAERKATREAFAQEIQLGKTLIIGLELMILLVTGGMLWHLASRILRNLGGEPEHALAIAERIANGELSHEFRGLQAPTGSLMSAMERMESQLRQFVGATNEAIDNVDHVSSSLAIAGKQLSGSAHQTSTSTGAMAATVSQLASNLEAIAANALGARQTSVDSGVLSETGRKIMGQTADGMVQIEQSTARAADGLSKLSSASDSISRVIDMIREVADQTNLLALNAAIEAARAGESGRGFAVVADEVRKLAERTASSTNEIQGLVTEVRQTSDDAVRTIEEVVSRVNEGAARAREADQAMAQIHGQTVQVVDMVTRISESLEEQEVAHADLVTRMGALADSAENNSQSAGDLAAHASRMQQLSGNLHRTVAWMRIS